MTLLEIIFVKGKTSIPNRHCICRCDICGKEFEISHNVKRAISKKYHFCSKKCDAIARHDGGLIQENFKLTCFKHFGVVYPMQSKEIQDKSKQACQIKYNVDNPFQSKEIQEKIKLINLERYGCENPFQSKEIQEKLKATMFERYGCENPTHCKEILDKIQQSRNDATQINHWKTGEELTCVASYEVAVVKWLNENKIDFQWQIQFPTPLLTPSGRYAKYTIDLHILDGVHKDKWIEIKGWERDMEKWEWFHSTYPNSELWNTSRLKELEIL